MEEQSTDTEGPDVTPDRSRRATTRPTPAAAPRVFLSLAADDAPLDHDQMSRTRKAFMVVAALLLLAATPLFWATTAGADDGPQAVLTKGSNSGPGGGDDDNSGPGGGDDDGDDTGATQTRSGRGDGTASDAVFASNTGTGRETRGNSDAQQTSGPSTRGETDGNDGTGATERR